MSVTFRTDALIAAAKETLEGHRKADLQYQADLANCVARFQ